MKKINIDKYKNFSITRISTSIALVISLLVTASTLGIALYSIFFVNTLSLSLSPTDLFQKDFLIFRDSIQRLVLAFLIFGMIASYFLSKMLIKPIEKLIKASKEISEGNLNHRIEKSRYAEINELVDIYNKMAENLQTLYINLENKVKERTKELETANGELKNAQVMMVHSEKMRSLGQLVAGITHEINNPINFIHGNLIHLKNYSQALIELIDLYQSFENDLSEEKQKTLEEMKEKIELNFIQEDLPKLIKSCQDGTERTKNIILDLKNFSRIDEMVINTINLEKEIETTLNILHNKIKGRIEIIKDYDENIPLVEGYGGQLNQVFMNILDNACYAIKNKGQINIKLKFEENDVLLEFKDTGCGMSEEQKEKIFEPFYTTKPVGEGTGLGLSISYKVIKNHHGTITVESEIDKGTIFKIRLPIKMERV